MEDSSQNAHGEILFERLCVDPRFSSLPKARAHSAAHPLPTNIRVRSPRLPLATFLQSPPSPLRLRPCIMTDLHLFGAPYVRYISPYPPSVSRITLLGPVVSSALWLHPRCCRVIPWLPVPDTLYPHHPCCRGPLLVLAGISKTTQTCNGCHFSKISRGAFKLCLGT